jgi:hypothetical protein
MRIYALVVSYVALVVATFGFILPFLISAASTELVLAGYFLLALFPIISYYSIMKIVNLTKEKINENS